MAALYIEWRDSTLKYDKLKAQNDELAKIVRKLEFEHKWFGKQFAFHADKIANLEDAVLKPQPVSDVDDSQFQEEHAAMWVNAAKLWQPK
ncbi:MAG: hypothetical protein IH587_02625 [Anaerolineae bacterium]|nr:hypothetical protein [Anaerolineae bacterium]